MSYQTVKLGDVCTFLYGEGLVEAQRRGGEFPVYGSNGIVGWHDRSLTNEPTIIIGRKGSIGEVHLSKVPCWPIDTTYYIQLKKKPCDLVWLYYTLLTVDLTKLNKSAAVPGLNRNDAYEMEIPLPPLPDQKHIAAILSKADRLRRLRRTARELSDGYLQAVFLEMFGDPVANPMGWERARVADLGKVHTGNTPSREEPENYGNFIEWIKSDNITNDEMFVSTSREMLSRIGLKKGRSVGPHSILVVCIAGSPTSIGNIALTDRRVAFNQQINAVTPNREVDPVFMFGLFRVAKPLIQRSTTLGMKRIITKSSFEQLLLIKPPLSLQRKFARVAQKHERLRAQQREAERQAEHLFQSLLGRAFRGEGWAPAFLNFDQD